MNAAACRVDYSAVTGSLVVCTCGLVLGPFHDYDEAKKEAREQVRWTGGDLALNDERKNELRRDYQRARHAAKRAGGT